MTKELPNPLVAEVMARKFHEAYERLAPSFGYQTRPDTKAFDPASPNGKLMIAVCSELLAQQEAAAWQGGLSNEQLRAAWNSKLPGVEPTDREMSAFALGVEVGSTK